MNKISQIKFKESLTMFNSPEFLSVAGMITVNLCSCWSEGAAKMPCGHWAATVCPAGFPAGTFNSFSKYACIVTVQIQTYCNSRGDRWIKFSQQDLVII